MRKSVITLSGKITNLKSQLQQCASKNLFHPVIFKIIIGSKLSPSTSVREQLENKVKEYKAIPITTVGTSL